MINKLFAFYPENTCNTLSFMKQDFKDKVQLCKKKKKKKAQNTLFKLKKPFDTKHI